MLWANSVQIYVFVPHCVSSSYHLRLYLYIVSMAAASNSMMRAVAFGASGLAVLYAGSNCLFNVEGGHRAIVFNRFGGFKDEVWLACGVHASAGVPISTSTCTNMQNSRTPRTRRAYHILYVHHMSWNKSCLTLNSRMATITGIIHAASVEIAGSVCTLAMCSLILARHVPYSNT